MEVKNTVLVDNIRFSHYLRLLSHPNERQRTDCLQDLFFFRNCSVVPIDDKLKSIAREKRLERIKRR